MLDPFRIPSPALISFSGGRTSGMMLHHILAAYHNKLPPDIHVCFANTGKEFNETLDFVHECASRWQVPIHWLEYRSGSPGFAEVDYKSASRAGEPYDAIIANRQYLPNPVARFCTVELKIKVFKKFAQLLGWTRWNSAIGFRADELHRVEKGREQASKRPEETPYYPLADLRFGKVDVTAFWDAQPFNLQLKVNESNCDLCFLKGTAKINVIMRNHPGIADWWIQHETVNASTFRTDRPRYAKLLDAVQRQQAFDFGIFDDLESCADNVCDAD